MKVVSTNITSPLGMTTSENIAAVLEGRSGLRHLGDYTASAFTAGEKAKIMVEGCTFFESLAYRSAKEALEKVDVDLSRTIFILSTTKENIESLDEDRLPSPAAEKISLMLGIPTEPVTVCNACISGLSALILAERLGYSYAVVTGCDIVGQFILSGFQSLKALDCDFCRPFDKTRAGLNLGEAAATIVLAKGQGGWNIAAGHIRNDANHISGPSRTAEGSWRALTATIGKKSPACVGVHGTGTLYNDDMESIALKRAGLDTIPVMALKGYFGHTMGAAGILETIIGMEAMDRGTVPAVKGLSEPGTKEKIEVSTENRNCSGPFVKLLSGFGGCNAAVYMTRENIHEHEMTGVETRVTASVKINEKEAWLNGKRIETSREGMELLKELYEMGDEYPKFFKMDILSKLAFAACQLLIHDTTEKRAVILFNRSSSIVSDLKHDKLSKEGFASPSVFVYTLPSIMTAEIAIRYGYRSETSLYILQEQESPLRKKIIDATFSSDPDIESILTGWVDAPSESEFTAELEIIEKI